MIHRILFALKMGWRYRKELSAFQYNPDLHASTLLSIDCYRLKSQGVKVLAIDFDGVLAPHGEDCLPLEIEQWLNTCVEIWGGDKIFILTNRPTAERQAFFSARFPSIQFVQSKKKKPYPDGVLYILEKTGVLASSLLVIDDRLLTGILACVIAGARGLWITQPLFSFKKRPILELFFMILRSLERWVLR